MLCFRYQSSKMVPSAIIIAQIQVIVYQAYTAHTLPFNQSHIRGNVSIDRLLCTRNQFIMDI